MHNPTVFLLHDWCWFICSFLHRPSIRISKLYSFFIALFAVAGAWISARQVWLQGLPEDEVPLCGPPLEYIIDVFHLLMF